MSLASSLESLRKIDINDLDLNNIGSWPAAVRKIPRAPRRSSARRAMA